MLDLSKRPQWMTVEGGSRAYIDAMMATIGSTTRTAQPVVGIQRSAQGVIVSTADTNEEFDEVILAAHADQSLAILADATEAERNVLSAMPYQANETVLHFDERLLPRHRRCWAAWNYRLTGDPARPAAVTYNMTMLQGLGTRAPLCVTLNDTDQIDPAKVIQRFIYQHPLYSLAGDRARTRWSEISGVNHTHYCGAYWGNGFHEDGVVSALRVCEKLGVRL
jgi:predicted NAD/FAD-binding protein